MGVTHQSHNIPWQVLAELYVQEPEYWRFVGGGKTGTTILKLRRDWPADRILKAARHFARRLASAIQDFAATERLKHPSTFPPTSMPLYDHPHFDHILIPGDYQKVEYWLKRQEAGVFDYDLADIAMQLLNKGMIDPLLRLVHAGVRLGNMAFVSQGFNNGISRILEDCLELYIHLNLAVAMDTWGLDHRKWPFQLREVRRQAFEWHVSRLPHAAFFALDEGMEEALTPFLAQLFRRLYHYHVVMAECGRFENWEQAALTFIPESFSEIIHYIDSMKGSILMNSSSPKAYK